MKRHFGSRQTRLRYRLVIAIFAHRLVITVVAVVPGTRDELLPKVMASIPEPRKLWHPRQVVDLQLSQRRIYFQP